MQCLGILACLGTFCRSTAAGQYTCGMENACEIIRLAHTCRQRWRNDGGWTREIARAGSADDWDWRLSLAEVEADGPFSAFPGIEREIVLLSGAGMALDFADGESFELAPETPKLRFAGERELLARLLDGPTRDFNLMWARQRFAADLWLRPLLGASTLFAAADETWVLHLASGHAQLLDAGNAELAAGDTLLLRANGERRRQRLEASGSAIVIRLQRRS